MLRRLLRILLPDRNRHAPKRHCRWGLHTWYPGGCVHCDIPDRLFHPDRYRKFVEADDER